MLDRVNRPSRSSVSYAPQKSDVKKKKKQQYGVEDTDRYNEPDSAMHSLQKGQRNRPINDFESDEDLDVEDYEDNSRQLRAEPPRRQKTKVESPDVYRSQKTKKTTMNDDAQRTLSKFSQAASAIEPSDAGSIFSNQHKSQKKKRRQMDDDEFLGHSSTKKLNQEGPTRKKSKRRDYDSDDY